MAEQFRAALIALNVSETEVSIITDHMLRHCTSVHHVAAVTAATKEIYELHIAATRVRCCESQRQVVMNAFLPVVSNFPSINSEVVRRLEQIAHQLSGIVSAMVDQARHWSILVDIPLRIPLSEEFWNAVWTQWPDNGAHAVLHHMKQRTVLSDCLYAIAFDMWSLRRWLSRWVNNLDFPLLALQAYFDESVQRSKASLNLVRNGLCRPSLSTVRTLLGQTIPIASAKQHSMENEALATLRSARYAVDSRTQETLGVLRKPRERLENTATPKFLRTTLAKLPPERGLLAVTTLRFLQRIFRHWRSRVQTSLQHRAMTRQLTQLCGSHHARSRLSDWIRFVQQRIEERNTAASRRVITLPQASVPSRDWCEALTQTPVQRRRVRL